MAFHWLIVWTNQTMSDCFVTAYDCVPNSVPTLKPQSERGICLRSSPAGAYIRISLRGAGGVVPATNKCLFRIDLTRITIRNPHRVSAVCRTNRRHTVGSADRNPSQVLPSCASVFSVDLWLRLYEMFAPSINKKYRLAFQPQYSEGLSAQSFGIWGSHLWIIRTRLLFEDGDPPGGGGPQLPSRLRHWGSGLWSISQNSQII